MVVSAGSSSSRSVPAFDSRPDSLPWRLKPRSHLRLTHYGQEYEPCQIHHPPKSECGKTSSAVGKNRVTKKVIKTLSKRDMASLAAKELDQAVDGHQGCGVQDRQGRRPPRASPQHGGSPQEQAGACLRRGSGQVAAGLISASIRTASSSGP